MYITVPEGSQPRDGVRSLSENARISIAEAAKVLDPETTTALEDVQDTS